MAAHLSTPAELQMAFDIPRWRAAKALRLKGYGIEVGGPAHLVLLDAEDVQEALRRQPATRVVVRRGRVVAETCLQQRVNLAGFTP